MPLSEDDVQFEERLHEFLSEQIDGMIQSWVISASYIGEDGSYQSFVLAAPDQLLHTSLGLIVMADELWRDEARSWGRGDTP